MKKSNPPYPTLLWPGKDRPFAREVLPLCLLEHHPEQACARSEPADCSNLLVQGDNLPLLSTLLDGPLRAHLNAGGGIKLIYCDPPFAVGADFTMPLSPGGRAVAYSDTWEKGLADFLGMMRPRLMLMRELLIPEGSLFLHCDWRTAPYLRLLLDEIFGPGRFLGDIVWHYTGGGRSKRWFSRKHDRILHYAAGRRWTFNPDAVRVPYKPGSGYARSGITSAAGKHYSPHPLGTPVDDVWDIPIVNPLSGERCGYPTQKPESLLERIILAASEPGDLVADFFGGSGTTAVAAARAGRRFLLADSSPPALMAARKRLLALQAQSSCFSFSVATLAPHEPRAREQNAPPASAGPEPETSETRRHEVLLEEGSMRYAVAEPRLALTRGGEGVVVSMLGYSLRKLDQEPRKNNRAHAGGLLPGGKAAALPDADDWRKTLDYWSLGACAPAPGAPGVYRAPLYNEVLWRSFQSRSGRQMDLRTPPLVLAPGTDRLVLTIGDIFGNTSHFSIPVDPVPRAESGRRPGPQPDL